MKKADFDLNNWSNVADAARSIYQMFYNAKVYMYWDANTCKPAVMFGAYTSIDLVNLRTLIKAIEIEDVDNDIKLAWYRLHFALLEFEQAASREQIISLNWNLL